MKLERYNYNYNPYYRKDPQPQQRKRFSKFGFAAGIIISVLLMSVLMYAPVELVSIIVIFLCFTMYFCVFDSEQRKKSKWTFFTFVMVLLVVSGALFALRAEQMNHKGSIYHENVTLMTSEGNYFEARGLNDGVFSFPDGSTYYEVETQYMDDIIEFSVSLNLDQVKIEELNGIGLSAWYYLDGNIAKLQALGDFGMKDSQEEDGVLATIGFTDASIRKLGHYRITYLFKIFVATPEDTIIGSLSGKISIQTNLDGTDRESEITYGYYESSSAFVSGSLYNEGVVSYNKENVILTKNQYIFAQSSCTKGDTVEWRFEANSDYGVTVIAMTAGHWNYYQQLMLDNPSITPKDLREDPYNDLLFVSLSEEEVSSALGYFVPKYEGEWAIIFINEKGDSVTLDYKVTFEMQFTNALTDEFIDDFKYVGHSGDETVYEVKVVNKDNFTSAYGGAWNATLGLGLGSHKGARCKTAISSVLYLDFNKTWRITYDYWDWTLNYDDLEDPLKSVSVKYHIFSSPLRQQNLTKCVTNQPLKIANIFTQLPVAYKPDPNYGQDVSFTGSAQYYSCQYLEEEGLFVDQYLERMNWKGKYYYNEEFPRNAYHNFSIDSPPYPKGPNWHYNLTEYFKYMEKEGVLEEYAIWINGSQMWRYSYIYTEVGSETSGDYRMIASSADTATYEVTKAEISKLGSYFSGDLTKQDRFKVGSQMIVGLGFVYSHKSEWKMQHYIWDWIPKDGAFPDQPNRQFDTFVSKKPALQPTLKGDDHVIFFLPVHKVTGVNGYVQQVVGEQGSVDLDYAIAPGQQYFLTINDVSIMDEYLQIVYDNSSGKFNTILMLYNDDGVLSLLQGRDVETNVLWEIQLVETTVERLEFSTFFSTEEDGNIIFGHSVLQMIFWVILTVYIIVLGLCFIWQNFDILMFLQVIFIIIGITVLFWYIAWGLEQENRIGWGDSLLKSTIDGLGGREVVNLLEVASAFLQWALNIGLLLIMMSLITWALAVLFKADAAVKMVQIKGAISELRGKKK